MIRHTKNGFFSLAWAGLRTYPAHNAEVLPNWWAELRTYPAHNAEVLPNWRIALKSSAATMYCVNWYYPILTPPPYFRVIYVEQN